MNKTFVIAEAAATHDGDFVKATALIARAVRIGADAIKFQWCSSPARLCERRHVPEYLGAYRLLAFPHAWFGDLAETCERVGIEFMCTVYLPEDIAVVAPHVKRFKVSSFEATDTYFVALHGEWPDIALIVSAGMSANVEPSLNGYYNIVATHGIGIRNPVAVLHCVSAYPCPAEQIGLAAIRHESWGGPRLTGLSDHTRHPWTGALAVAAGAKIVEFHIRLDDTDPSNSDYAVARSPEEARVYVENIRTAEAMLGDGLRGIQPCEEPMLRYRVRP